MTLAPSPSCEYSAAQNRYLRALTTRCRSSTVAPCAALFLRSPFSIAAFLRVLCVGFGVAFAEGQAKDCRQRELMPRGLIPRVARRSREGDGVAHVGKAGDVG